MEGLRAEVAIVEDRKVGREDFQGLAQDLSAEGWNYSINVPESFDTMERLFLFRNFDGFLIDVNLRLWDLSKRLIKHVTGVGPIRDGIDVAHLAFKLFRKAKDAICIYSSEVNLHEPQWSHKINSLPFNPTIIPKVMSYDMAKKVYLEKLLEEADRVRMANPILQLPRFSKMSLKERLHAFKSLYFNNANWVNCHFDNVGDYSWVVVCGHDIEKDLYGPALTEKWSRKFEVQSTAGYLDARVLNRLASSRQFFPFIFWNTRKPEFIESHFTRAGPKLTQIPKMWQSFFGIAMARPCARSYVEDSDRRVLKWSEELDPVGKLELARLVFKKLRNQVVSRMSEFKRAVKRHELPEVVDILEGRVEEIRSNECKVIVVLRSPYGGSPFTEVFDLNMLRQANVKFVAQRFEYMVYKQPQGHVAVSVEPIYEEEQ